MKHTIRTGTIQLCLVGLLALVTACGNRDDTTAPIGNGTIVLTLTLPDGVTPSVTITGPNGFSRSVSSTTTFTHLAAGSYIITADSIVIPNTIVGYDVDTAHITGNPIIVTAAGSSAATIAYSFARVHGALWLANYAETHVSGFARSQLLLSSDVAPADTIGAAQFPGGIAFDTNGDLWVSTDHADSLKMFTVAQRNDANAVTAPTRSLVSADLSSPQVLAFDSHGNLWVADENNGLLEFTAAQLAAANGTPVSANVRLTDTLPPSTGTYAIVFDGAGNAWVGENNSDNIIEYTVAQLAASGSPTPNVRLGVDQSAGSLVHGGAGTAQASARTNGIVGFGILTEPINDPDALAFDSQGNLWVANYRNENVIAYSPAQRATSGNPTPLITIGIPNSDPFGLAFDKEGGLWVSDDFDGRVLGFTAAQIAASGAPVPNVILLGSKDVPIQGPQQLAFDEWVVPATPPAVVSRVPYRASASSHSARLRKKLRRL